MITIVQKNVNPQVLCTNAIGAELVANEAFTATNNQTTFPLANIPRSNGISIVTINTILQSIAQGDYSFDTSNNLVFNAGLQTGDKVAIMYEVL
jgi:hypothetical protein